MIDCYFNHQSKKAFSWEDYRNLHHHSLLSMGDLLSHQLWNSRLAILFHYLPTSYPLHLLRLILVFALHLRFWWGSFHLLMSTLDRHLMILHFRYYSIYGLLLLFHVWQPSTEHPFSGCYYRLQHFRTSFYHRTIALGFGSSLQLACWYIPRTGSRQAYGQRTLLPGYWRMHAVWSWD